MIHSPTLHPQVPPRFTHQHLPMIHSDGLETSLLGLHLRLSDKHFSRGLLRLKCEARVEAHSTSSRQDYMQDNRALGPLLLEVKEHVLSGSYSLQ